MWRRSVLSATLAASALLAAALPALAGGWAVTTLDGLPADGFRAGEAYRLGYTIRQHGDKPFGGAKTEVRIWSVASGEYHAFVGVPEGAVGHYVAEIRFPAAGAWTWEVSQEPFAPQKLGAILVAPAVTAADGPSPAVAEPGRTDLAVLRFALPMATMLAVALFAHRLSVFMRGQRLATDLRVPRVAGGSE